MDPVVVPQRTAAQTDDRPGGPSGALRPLLAFLLWLGGWMGDLLQVSFVVLVLCAWQWGVMPTWEQLTAVLLISRWWWLGLLCGLLLITAVHRLLFPVSAWFEGPAPAATDPAEDFPPQPGKPEDIPLRIAPRLE